MIEKIILSHLIDNNSFMRKVIPYIKKEYFEERIHQVAFEMLDEYIKKYNNLPSKQALLIDLLDREKINDEEKEQIEHLILGLQVDPKSLITWVEDETEKWCQKRAMYIGLTKSLEIFQAKDGALGSIPNILQNALAISFDNHIGHDFFEDSDDRFEYYHKIENKIPFDLEIFNRITKGGVSKKSLTILMAGVHVGKSAMMCHMAAANIKAGKKVLYISLEMSEEMISQRIEANLMDMAVDSVLELPKPLYSQHMKKLRTMWGGDLKIKEYPVRRGGSANFRHLLNELKLKKNFIPDIIYIDYMNICASSTTGKNTPKHEVVIAISEELRGLATEFDLPIITATQFNREGYKSSDPGMDNIAESFGSTATGDLILALVRSEEMDAMNQMMVTQLKNRFSDLSKLKRFVIGFHREKMQLFDVEDKEQTVSLDLPYDKETGEIFTKERIGNLDDIWKKT